jgi:hypothetical protein
MPTKTAGFVAKLYLEPFDYQGVRLLDGMLKSQYSRTRDYYSVKLPQTPFSRNCGMPLVRQGDFSSKWLKCYRL